MQQFIEYLPVVGFLLAYLLFKDIFLATSVLIGLYVLVFLFLKFTNQEITNSFKLTFWLVLVFGGMTIFFQNQQFIQWKPTLFCWACASFLVLHRIKGKDVYALKNLVGDKINLPDSGWRFLTYYSAIFLFLEGALNIWVAYHFTLDQWVSFKVVGLPILSFLMIFSAFGYLIYNKQINEQTLNVVSPEDKQKLVDKNTNV